MIDRSNESKTYWNQSVGSDVYPYELIRKIGKTQFELRQMDTLYDNGEYQYISNTDRHTIRVSRRKDGTYREIGDKYCYFVPSDYPRKYLDPHF